MTDEVSKADCATQVKACATQFRSMRSLIVSLLTLAGIGALVVSGSGWIGWTAHTEASKARRSIGEHVAASVERDKSIDDKLDMIQASQLRMSNKLDAYIQRGN